MSADVGRCFTAPARRLARLEGVIVGFWNPPFDESGMALARLREVNADIDIDLGGRIV